MSVLNLVACYYSLPVSVVTIILKYRYNSTPKQRCRQIRNYR